jgi:hypothetical protein
MTEALKWLNGLMFDAAPRRRRRTVIWCGPEKGRAGELLHSLRAFATDTTGVTSDAIASRAVASRLTTLRWLVAAATVLLLAVLVSSTTADPDLWGHLRFGLDVLALRGLPRVDPYSFTQDMPIVYHEWLGAVIMALAYGAGGVAGLLVLKTVIIAAAWALLWRSWRHAHPVAAGAAMLVAAWGALPVTQTIRPQLWTLLGLLLLFEILQRPLTAFRLVGIAVMFAVWVNLHGGFIVGLALLGVWCAVDGLLIWRRSGSPPWPQLMAPGLAVLATAANPYGVELWAFLARTVRPGRNITEWLPLWTTPVYTWIPILITAAILVIVPPKRSWPTAAVLVVLWIGALSTARVAPLAVPLTLLFVASGASVRWPASGWKVRAPSPAAALFMVIPVLAGTVAAIPYLGVPYECLRVGQQDPDGMARLRATAGPGRIAVYFDWGQYALWHLGPRLKVSWDGRRETLYSQQTQDVQSAVVFGLPAGDRWLLEVKPEYVWLPARLDRRREWLLAHGYRIDHRSATSYIAVRDDLPPLPAAVSPDRCFP